MMKTISMFMMASIFILGASSCSQDKDDFNGVDTGLSGSLTINLGFEDIIATRAAQSTGVIPTTTWTKSIKSMTLLLTDGGVIKRVLDVPLQTQADAASIKKTFNGLPEGTYEAYLLANYDQTATPFGTGAITAVPLVTGANLLGTNISSLKFNLNSVTPAAPDSKKTFETNMVGEPSEIFLAKVPGVKVEPDVTTECLTPFSLKRAVSLLRVRVNKVYDPSSSANVDNSSIDFATGTIRLRNHGIGLSVSTAAGASTKPFGVDGAPTTTPNSGNVFYSAKAFKTDADFVAADYKAGANMGLSAGDFTLWNEYMILPGGNKATGTGSGATKYNVVLSGKTTNATYVPADRTTAVPAGTLVYWTGQVTGEAGPNEILELNISPKSAGTAELPESVEYGNLEINVNLLEWGTVYYVDLPL